MKNTLLPVFLATLALYVNRQMVMGLRSQKSVNVVLDAKWPTTPLHLEVSEFLSEESSNLFWKFIEDVIQLGPSFLQDRTPKQQYDSVMEIASHHLSPARLALLKFSLALRAYSPTIEMFNQVADSKEFPLGCDTVVEIGDEFACTLKEFEELLSTAGDRQTTSAFKVDHHYPNFGGMPLPVAVLYAEIGSKMFHEFHRVLVEKSENNEVDYVLRHFVFKRSNRKARLSGYGVELAIKSTEYKAQDDTEVKEDSARHQEEIDKQEEIEGFLFHRLKELHPDKKEHLEKFKTHILDSTKEMETLKVWELQELSLQAAKRILGSPKEEVLRVMQDISQNFPLMAKSLVHITVPSELKREIEKNQQMFAQFHNLGPSEAAIFLNGLYFDVEVTDIFTLLQTLKQETRVLEGLHSIGIDEKKISKLLHLDLSEDKQDFAVDIRDTAIQFINDIENDKMYRNWPSSIQDLLRVTYPGMLKNVRKNMYHLIIVADPKDTENRDLFKLAESFYIHKAPVRIGLVLAVNPNMSVSGSEDAGVAMLIAYNFVSQKKTPYDGLSFITDVYASLGDKELTSEEVIKIFKGKYSHEEYDSIFSLESDYDFGRKLAWEFINRTGMGVPPQVLVNGIILKKNQLNVDMFEEAVLTEIMKQTSFIQKAVYKGDLTDSHNVIDFIMSQKNVMPRLNKKILTPGSKYLDLTGDVVEEVSKEEFSHLSVKNLAATFESKLHYLRRKDTNFFHPISLWVVSNLETATGREIVYNAVKFLKSSDDFRLAIIHNTKSVLDGVNTLTMSVAVQAIVEKLDNKDSRQLLLKILKPNNSELIISGTKKISDFLPVDTEVNAAELDDFISSFSTDFLSYHSIFCKLALNLASSERAVVANGRIIAPLQESESFGEDDYNLLEKYSLSVFGDKLSKILSDQSDDAPSQIQSSHLILQSTAVLMSNQQSKTRHDIKYHSDKHSVIALPASDSKEPAHEILAVVDPVSRGGQKMATLLLVLQRVVNANVKIFLNCVDKHSDMPLKSFYRFVLEHEPQFGADENLSPGPFARFNNMPSTPLLTLGMGVPENWMVECVRTHHDLDNIHLEKVESGIYAEFELEHLLLEGHCFEQSTGNPPRGLQFTLGTAKQLVKVDTIVMANLGYFQLKASPGVWFLRLRHGRSEEIYDVAGHENTDSPPGSPEVVVAITNFRSHVIKIRVNKKPGKQNEELLYDGSESAGGIWDSITSSFTMSNEKDKDDVDDKLNIFSLASGHLYERLLRIMMLSVLKTTKTPVKFWFLKNYLSPTFKDFLPTMAKEYDFQYELVQYKWPRWLNQQTEKQRIIWGYKILFLDVLFPLDVKKFIFVDADQVVRADMKELRDLDLGGAPYGYTPFCESRTDMDGYRFWKSGYWASHLAHRKYHISALYVVDLKKFRRIAAGDRLRGQYQGLSQDPNSLSNLDQDLPNNMIHQVNIKSLPQEWLWCETWCDDSSKKNAKTIDLCNNPKTKESKLQAAMRIIPEWKGYDDEIKNRFERFENQKKNASFKSTMSNSNGGERHEEL